MVETKRATKNTWTHLYKYIYKTNRIKLISVRLNDNNNNNVWLNNNIIIYSSKG